MRRQLYNLGLILRHSTDNLSICATHQENFTMRNLKYKTQIYTSSKYFILAQQKQKF